ncbi:MAG: threonine synthase [candidate division NC10 bacterium]|nr:threonine synthase [candidate division NC10 bacterium]
MPMVNLECTRCGATHSPATLINLCTCGGILYPRYDLAGLRSKYDRNEVKDGPATLWRYRRVLPVRDEANVISLGEGFTPIFPARRRGPFQAYTALFIKDEGPNPTASFKARGMSSAISMAKELGAREVALPSAGNAGSAAAAYAAAAGLTAYVFMPDDTPTLIVSECIAYGARVYLVKGLINVCGKLVAAGAKTRGWFDLSTLKEPYRVEGKKTMGYEVAEQLGWELPDWIFYPTGGGTGLVGMWKAFAEMEALGWIGRKRPRMVAIQAIGCQPIVKAFAEGRSDSVLHENAHTVASGLRVPKALGDYLILQALRESRGLAIAVTDEELLRAQREIAETQGILPCPEGGATWAALQKLVAEGTVKPTERIVLFNTGSGLKYPELLPREAPVLDPNDPKALDTVA